MADLTELLRKVAIFKDLTDDELALVAETCNQQRFNSGDYIFHEGEEGNRLYLIIDGEVRISRDVPGSGEEALAILFGCFRTGCARPTTHCVPSSPCRCSDSMVRSR